jgi:twitching motility protein PilT
MVIKWEEIKKTFISEKKFILQKLKNHQWASADELQELLTRLGQLQDITFEEIAWMLLDVDQLKGAASRIIAGLNDPAKLEKILMLSKGKADKDKAYLLQIFTYLAGNQLVKYLRMYASHKEDYFRAVVLELLPKLEQTQGIPIASVLLKDNIPNHRLQAMSYLVSTNQPQALWMCVSLFNDEEEEVRFRAIKALSHYVDDRLIPILLKIIRRDVPRVQEAAVEALLNQIKESRADLEDEIVSFLRDSNPNIRKIASQLLQKSDPVRIMRKFLLAFKDSFGWVRERALHSLRESSDKFIEGVLALLDDKDPLVRELAESIAITIEDKRAVPALIRLLNHEDWWFRYCAAETLGKIGDLRSFVPLLNMLKNEETRLCAIEALGMLKEPKALSYLTELLPIANKEEKLEIIEAMRIIRNPSALPHLKKIYEEEEDYLKERARVTIEEISGAGMKKVIVEEKPEKINLRELKSPKINDFLKYAIAHGASDFHIALGSQPLMRVHGELTPVDYPPISPLESQRMIIEILNDQQLAALGKQKNIDFCYKVPGLGRFRTNVFVQRNGIDAVFRIIPSKVPSFESVGLPNNLRELVHYHQGLILVTGPSGCGKTTTLAALVDLINETRSCHIITIEDPIEYVHSNKVALVNQREVNSHTESFSSALRASLREDPDVILVGEMRDLETVRMAITAAETGHLVLTTLHTTSAASSIDRIIGTFPPEEQWQIRIMISESLKAIITQVLLPNAQRNGLIPAFEILIVTQAIASLIREGKTFQIPSIQQTSHHIGMCLLDESILKLVQEKKVDVNAAYAKAFKKELIEPYLENKM